MCKRCWDYLEEGEDVYCHSCKRAIEKEQDKEMEAFFNSKR